MTIPVLITILILIALLIYQNDRTRKWISGMFPGEKTFLLLAIIVLTMMAVFYPRINEQIKKLKQKLKQ